MSVVADRFSLTAPHDEAVHRDLRVFLVRIAHAGEIGLGSFIISMVRPKVRSMSFSRSRST